MQKRNVKSGALSLAALPLAFAGLFNTASAQDAAPPAMTAEEKA